MKIKRFMNKDLIIAYFYRGGGVLLAFALNIVLARLYGADLSGQYYVLYNFLAVVASVAFLGFSYVIVHFLTPHYAKDGDPEKGNMLLSLSVAMIIAMFVITSILLYVFREQFAVYLFKDAGYSDSIILIVLAMAPYLLILLLTEIFKALGRPNQSILAINIIGNVVLILLLLVNRTNNIERVFRLFIVAYAISGIALLIVYWKLFVGRGMALIGPSKLKPLVQENYELCRKYGHENITLSLVAFSNILLSVFDTFVISHQLSSTDVALYSVANKVVSFGSIILTTVNSLIGYQIAQLSYKKDNAALSKLLVKYTRIMIPLGFLYYIFALLFSCAIPFVFGGEYYGSIQLCNMLALGQFISIITGPCSYFAIMTGYAGKYTAITIASAAISVISNLILVPIMGIYGAVISNLVTLSFKNIYTFVFAKSTVGLKVIDFIKKGDR